MFSDNFDPTIDNSQWTQIFNGFANGNFGGSGNSLFFTGSGSRLANSRRVNTTGGGTISFDLIFGNSRNGGENADFGEDVVLEYSTNNGNSWFQIARYDTEDFTAWTNITAALPAAAQTTGTNFRWRQVTSSGSNFDNWGLDNVSYTPGFVLQDDFDPSIDFSQWRQISRGVANRNFGGSGNSLFFTGSGSRFAFSNAVDLSGSSTIAFDLIFGNSANGGENADAGEDVVLEYSTNGGGNWTQIARYDTEDFTTWNSLTATIPTAAKTNSTNLRWRQVRSSGSNFDNWGLDNIEVGAASISNGSKSGFLQGTNANDSFHGSFGNDNYEGLNGTDGIDYTELGSKITLLPQGVIRKGTGSSAQTDTIENIERIVAPATQTNVIDGDDASTSSFNIDLGRDFLEVRGIPGLGNVSFTVENFVDVFGTANDDIIEGSAGNNRIEGGAGDDRLIGETPNGDAFGNDILLGGPGDDLLDGAGLDTPNEVDRLTGGTGADIFSLQDDGDIYASLTVITDFNVFEGDRISLPGVGRTAFVNRLEFRDGDFDGRDGAYLTRLGASVAGEQVAFFEYNIGGGIGNEAALNNLFSSTNSPII